MIAAILESEVFGPYVKPDYEALINRRNAMATTHGETVQHSLKGSDAGIARPVPEKPGEHDALLESVMRCSHAFP